MKKAIILLFSILIWSMITTPALAADLPDGETRYATFITEESARLNAYLADDGGEACEVRFQYYYSDGTWTDNETPWLAGYLTGEEPYVDIDTLIEGEVYYCRVQIKNGAGTFDGQSVAFTPYNAPSMPSRWFATPNVERFHNAFFYGLYNFIADRTEIPRDIFYMLATLFWCIVIFAAILIVGRRLVPAIYGVSGSMAIASLLTLLPMFFIGFSAIGFLGAIKMGHPREE
jgi:hypothetical protein